MMRKFREFFIAGAGFAAGLACFSLLSVLLANSVTSFNSGDLISAAQINENFQIVAPPGLIASFFLTECPSGWVQADGNNDTPDLRGAFIRGLNTFDNGSTANNRDPADTGARSIGHYQTDAFQGHWHEVYYYVHNDANGPQQPHILNPIATQGPATDRVRNPITGSHGAVRLSTETRPLNVALIYCMRKDT